MTASYLPPLAPYPTTRLRRNRRDPWSRKLVAENILTAGDLIWPVFVHDEDGRAPVDSMPDAYRLSISALVDAAGEAAALGIPTIAVFPAVAPALKDPDGHEAVNPDNLVCRAVAALKQALPGLGVLCDVALDPFTSHGHDGVIRDGYVANDETVAILQRQAIVQAEAGCDIIAPSDMMDGRVGAIRKALDGAGFEDIAIMSYAAKYCSGFYGPFREAAESAPQFGDRRSYQMDPANAREAIREVELDLAEGADMVMVKPALAYLDIIHRVRETFDVPVGAYNVSGEFAMVKAAAANGWIDEKRIVLEILTGIHRAGASIVLTYHAKDIARWMKAC